MSDQRPRTVSYDENPEWTEETFASARDASEVHGAEFAAGMVRKPGKEIAPRIDADVLAAYKATGPGWQARMNDVLRRALPSVDIPAVAATALWAVVIRGEDYAIRQLRADEIFPPDAIAVHPNRTSAELALERVEAYHLAIQPQMRSPIVFERDLREKIAGVPNAADHPDLVQPKLDASAEHEVALINGRITGLTEIAQPRKLK